MNALVVVVFVAGCTEPRGLSGPCTDCTVGVHAPGLQDLASDNFHGRVLARLDWGFPVCAGCHGSDFSGSTSGVSCLGCHRDGPTACTTCHGAGPTSLAHGAHARAGSPAPPFDLAGNQFTTAVGVGAHQAHLLGGSRLSAPVPCATCHVVPASIDAPGHIDTPAPAEVTPGLGWDRTAQTCASSSCHGDARPTWTSRGQVSCGSCHGIPPASAPHTAVMTLMSRAACHPSTVDALGTIIVDHGASEHINGRVEHQ